MKGVGGGGGGGALAQLIGLLLYFLTLSSADLVYQWDG